MSLVLTICWHTVMFNTLPLCQGRLRMTNTDSISAELSCLPVLMKSLWDKKVFFHRNMTSKQN